MKRFAVSLAMSRRSRPEELMLVERNPKLRYFGGFLAFPGGTLDPEDEDIPVSGLEDPQMARFIAAGARELFEETGIWLGRGGKSAKAEELRTDRRRLLAEEVSFKALMERRGQHLDGRDLVPLCRITTPPFSLVRFDTWFLRGLVPDGATVEIWDGELVGGDYADPAETLTRWRGGEVQIAPPMVVLLEEWSKGPARLEERVFELTEAYRRGELHRIYFSPGILLVPLETPTQPPATHTNTYVVGEKELFVIDPSPVDRNEQSRFWAFLEKLISEGRRLEGILLTHYHPDHIGALDEMLRRYELPVYAHADCAAHLPRVHFERTLEHGDTIDLGTAPDGSKGWKLEVYHVPGHAEGHLAFRESRYGAIIVGDLVSTLSSILIDPSDGHLATYLESLRFLETVTEGTLYPGHGPPTPNGKAVIHKTLEHRAEREAQLLAALTTTPQTTQELLVKIYTDVDPKMYPLAERSLLSGLKKLEEEGLGSVLNNLTWVSRKVTD
jgi:ribonuclease/clavin/mitogillin